MKQKVKIIKIIKETAGRNHVWCEAVVGKVLRVIRKPKGMTNEAK